MLILHYCNNIDIKYGGPSRSIVLLCNELSLSNKKVFLLTQFQNSIPINNKVKIINFYSKKLIGRISLFFNFLILKDNKIEIVHIHGLWDFYHVILILFCLFKKIPYFIQPRGMLEPWSLKQRKFLKFIMFNIIEKPLIKLSKGIITTSKLEKHNIENLKIKVPLFLLPNGAYLPNRKDISTSSNNRELKHILFFSRIHEKKGIEILISAFSRLIKDYPDFQLTIAGNGEPKYVNRIKSSIKNYPNHIKYVGEVLDNDKVSLFNSHDFFILPTFSENFGIVLLESLTCGLPIITTKESSWADIEKENLGFLIEANENSILNGLKKIIKLKSIQYRKLCVSCKKYATRYNWVNISKTAKKIYRFHEK